MKITFLGGGNMAAALIGGLVKQGFKAADVQAVELSAEGRAKLESQFGVRAVESLDEQALACDVLVLAVKPQQLKAAVAPIAGRLTTQVGWAVDVETAESRGDMPRSSKLALRLVRPYTPEARPESASHAEPQAAPKP